MSREPSSRIGKLTCRIAIADQPGTAYHEYEYSIFGLSAQPDLDFSFFVPNATREELKDVTAEEESYDGQPQTGLPPIVLRDGSDGHGSWITFTYLRPLTKGAKKRLKFAYRAPTSAPFYKDPVNEVVFYQAHFFHRAPIDLLELNLILPKRSRIKKVEPIAKWSGTTVNFREENIPHGHRRFYSVFFVKRLRFRALVISLLTLGAGAALHALGSGAIAGLGHWLEDKLHHFVG